MEGFLKNAKRNSFSKTANSAPELLEGQHATTPFTCDEATNIREPFSGIPLGEETASAALPTPSHHFPHQLADPAATMPGADNPQSQELIGLGRFESLPPIEMIEEL